MVLSQRVGLCLFLFSWLIFGVNRIRHFPSAADYIPKIAGCSCGKVDDQQQAYVARTRRQNTWLRSRNARMRYSIGMDHLEVLREKISRLRAEIAQIQEL